ncbi:MAG: hypothetical protein QOJ65_224 [Fimbriimonadaceae bacterium]|nr:hypothetical protein [Fimbriimonadaceae bacterium]
MIRKVLLAFVMASCVLGCSEHMSPQEYSHAWRQAVLDYRAIEKSPETAAALAASGDPGGSRAAAIGGAAQHISDQIREIAARVKEFNPPPNMQPLQDETYSFYRGQADLFQGYASALGEGDSGKVDAAGDRVNLFVDEHQKKVKDEITNLRNQSDQFQSAWLAVLKPIPRK